ncbi:hypothetical protein EMIHUDRAFT_103555 [Emiliania huxleyi CCMP1516]|uniref:Uncharacterized protein n=2 Tax=Emiliania huxleyi TaxID=2903 RepID=A0A0D3IS47_EMIH1|nr:hypothetical protein EMIHUDRAFT_103555 [Emiliania huxleyi CCMP1516]EOD14082.1 hypothetical protein EMIHUDRAFT_103555 [Emiliania huxleyi CCMP1516]|eukprot:XP_005766511.1 hypothetical protein EMIHUDRAFT_103555 [Emiliania huxleyi CCMP1516]
MAAAPPLSWASPAVLLLHQPCRRSVAPTAISAFAGFLQHCVNLVFGVAFAASGAASECAWYLTNFVISVVCGVLLLNLAMAGYNRCVDRFGLHLLRSGEYGKPPSWRPWLMQMLVWGFLASAEKRLDAVAQLIEAPVHHYPKAGLSRYFMPASSPPPS